MSASSAEKKPSVGPVTLAKRGPSEVTEAPAQAMHNAGTRAPVWRSVQAVPESTAWDPVRRSDGGRLGSGPSRPGQGAGSGVSLAGDELGHGPGEGHNAVVPAGDNCKGGSTTALVGNKEEGSSSGVKVAVVMVEKGKTDSSNTTWREMRTRREVRSKHR